MEDIEREMQLEEEKRNLERDKERTKPEAADRAQHGLMEAKLRKQEIENMQRERMNELKMKVRDKERAMEDKYNLVHEDK